MPTGRESVVNKALSGAELKKIILADAQRLVDNEGLLSHHIAFGRVSYTLTLRIHVDNPYVPDSKIELASRVARDAAGELIPQVESAPLTQPSPHAEVGEMELTRTIDSPNSERLRNAMPIPVLTRQQDSTTQMEQISYPEGSFPELGAGDVVIKDKSEELRRQWK